MRNSGGSGRDRWAARDWLPCSLKKFCLALFLLLCRSLFFSSFPVLSHEGHKHEDIREGGTVTLPPLLQTSHVINREVKGKAGTYMVNLTFKPATPLVKIENQFELAVMRLLPEPDPFLGSEVPVDDADVAAFIQGKGVNLGPLRTHAEARGGVYGIHSRLEQPGKYVISFHVTTPDGGGEDLLLAFPFTVSPFPGTALALRIDWWVGLGCLVVWLLLLLYQVRKGAQAHPAERGLLAFAASSLALLLLVASLPVSFGHFFLAPRGDAPYDALLRPGVSFEKIAMEERPLDQLGPVHLSSDLQRILGIRIARVERRSSVQTVTAMGKVVVPAQKVHKVHSPVLGKVRSASVIPAVGDMVRQGQIMAIVQQTFSASERLQLQGQILDLDARIRQARNTLEQRGKERHRAEELYKIKAISQRDLQLSELEYQNARVELQSLTDQRDLLKGVRNGSARGALDAPTNFPVMAPISGVIVSSDIANGELIDPGKELFTIMDLSTMWVEALIYEKDLGAVLNAHAREAAFVLDAFPGETYHAVLRTIGSTVDPQNRTIKAIFEARNPEMKLRDGMFAMVTIQTSASRRVVSVDPSALVDENGKKYIFKKTGEEEFTPVEVQTGGQSSSAIPSMIERATEQKDGAEGFVVIEKGIQEGDEAVTQGGYQLKSEARRQKVQK